VCYEFTGFEGFNLKERTVSLRVAVSEQSSEHFVADKEQLFLVVGYHGRRSADVMESRVQTGKIFV